MGFKNKLKAMNEQWKEAKAGQSNPLGQFETTLQNVVLKDGSGGGMFVSFEYLIKEGEHAGSVVRTNRGIVNNDGKVNDVGLSVLKGWIEQVGYEVPEDMTDLEALFEEITRAAISISIAVAPDKKDPQYTRVTVLGVGDGEAPTAEGEVEGALPVEEGEVVDAVAEAVDGENAEVDEALEADRVAMIAFGQKFELPDVSDESTIDDVKALLADYNIDGNLLTKDERELLDRVEVEYSRPAPKPLAKPAAKPTAKAPAKPAPKAPAKAPAKAAAPAKKGVARKK